MKTRNLLALGLVLFSQASFAGAAPEKVMECESRKGEKKFVTIYKKAEENKSFEYEAVFSVGSNLPGTPAQKVNVLMKDEGEIVDFFSLKVKVQYWKDEVYGSEVSATVDIKNVARNEFFNCKLF